MNQFPDPAPGSSYEAVYRHYLQCGNKLAYTIGGPLAALYAVRAMHRYLGVNGDPDIERRINEWEQNNHA